MKQVSFTSPGSFQMDAEEISRRQKLAEQLQAESMGPGPQGQMVSGWYVGPSWTQGLAHALKGVQGSHMRDQALKDRQELQGRMSAERSDTLARALAASKGAPASTETIMDETANGGMGQMANINAPAVQADPMKAMGILAGSQDPMLSQMGANKMLERAFPAPQQPYTLAPGAVRYGPDNQPIANAPFKDAPPQTRNVRIGDQQVSQEYDPATKQWREIGRGPAFARQVAPIVNVRGGNAPAPRPPSGFRFSVDGETLEPIPGGPHDKPKDRPLTATERKEVFDADNKVLGGRQAIEFLTQAKALNDKAMGFPGAGAVATVGSILPEGMRPKSVDDTLEFDNLIQNSAIPQLKAIFGGNPTEGERKILLEVAGSSSKPASVRKGIIDRAIQMAEQRMRMMEGRADGIRSGTYFSPNGANRPPATNGNPATSVDSLLEKYK